MTTEKQSFKDRTIKKILSGTRFVKSGLSQGEEHEDSSPNNTGAGGKSQSKWYDLEDHEFHLDPKNKGHRSPFRKRSKSDSQKKPKKSVTHTKSATTWFLHDEYSSKQDTSKETSPDQMDPGGKLERSGSLSKKKVQPEGTFEYKVKNADTLSSIAAHFDVTPSELKKLNKLSSQFIFPEQVLYIPSADQKKSLKIEESGMGSDPPKNDRPKMDIPIVKMGDRPPSKIPGHAERQTPVTSPRDNGEFEIPHKLDDDEVQQLDQDCFERFIKVNCKHITDGQGVVSGVLLVTPNAVMFDPNVSDPLVIEHGADKYGVIAPMDMIISCAMYHDIVAMNMRKNLRDHPGEGSKPEVYHDKSCPHYQSWVKGHSDLNLAGSEVKDDKTSPSGNSEQSDSMSVCSCGADPKLSPQKSPGSHKLAQGGSPVSSNFEIISQSSVLGDTRDTDPEETIRNNDSANADSGIDKTQSGSNIVDDLIDFSIEDSKKDKFYLEDNESESANQKSQENSHKNFEITSVLDSRKHANNQDSNSKKSPVTTSKKSPGETSKKSPGETNKKSPGEMRIGNIVYMPVSEDGLGEPSEKSIQEVKQTLSQLSIDDFENKEKTPSAPVDVPVVSMVSKADKDNGRPKSVGSFSDSLNTISPRINTFVNYATGLFRPDSKAEIKDVSEMPQDSSTRHFSAAGRNLSINMTEQDFAVAVESAVKLADKPYLFQSFDKLIPKPAVSYEDPPLYLCMRLGKPISGEISNTCPIAAYSKQKKKPEYWFSIPREKVDPLYAFFVQWKPEIYGDDDEMMAQKRGFVVLSDETEDSGDIEILDEYFGSGSLQKDWEIISTEEMLKRKSVDIDEISLMPELQHTSNILQDYHLVMLSSVMPARTVGYPWSLIYSSEKHGFSLKTMYRHMQNIDSPVLLVVKDTNEFVFGAMTSCELKVSDHFYGTGESFLFTFYPVFKVFRWTGENSFFIKGNQESLSIGAGQGQFGLWFDGDIYHGRTNRCETYDNDILTSSEDFVVGCFEAWAFTDD